MADHVAEFLASMKIFQLNVYGFSIGGYIAQQFALDRPDLVRKLILSESPPGSRFFIRILDTDIASSMCQNIASMLLCS
jgi:pimeloyl-ACP methyl ester carboxylesterase